GEQPTWLLNLNPPRRLTMATAYSIGIDLHRTVIQICVLDERGERVAEERIRYRSLDEGREAIAWLRRFAPGCRIAVEALGLNRWFVNACLAAGLDVLVCDPRKLDLKKLGKKTDSARCARDRPAPVARRPGSDGAHLLPERRRVRPAQAAARPPPPDPDAAADG